MASSYDKLHGYKRLPPPLGSLRRRMRRMRRPLAELRSVVAYMHMAYGRPDLPLRTNIAREP
jgi:hypothetical protein